MGGVGGRGAPGGFTFHVEDMGGAGGIGDPLRGVLPGAVTATLGAGAATTKRRITAGDA